jgi:hypothetical protein
VFSQDDIQPQPGHDLVHCSRLAIVVELIGLTYCSTVVRRSELSLTNGLCLRDLCRFPDYFMDRGRRSNMYS